MAENLVVRGLIATDPRLIETDKGLSVLSFRLAAPQRRFDAEAGRWTSDQTNWFSVWVLSASQTYVLLVCFVVLFVEDILYIYYRFR